jgi:translation elongation factor EF-4
MTRSQYRGYTAFGRTTGWTNAWVPACESHGLGFDHFYVLCLTSVISRCLQGYIRWIAVVFPSWKSLWIEYVKYFCWNNDKRNFSQLTLTDRSVTIQRESSTALGQGLRLGFLGTLHMDVFRQRLEDEYDANILITAPTVTYQGEYLNYMWCNCIMKTWYSGL